MKLKPKYVQLIKGYPFIGGHLLQYITPNRLYPVVDIYGQSPMIIDDKGNDVWLSNSVIKQHMKPLYK